MSHPVLEDRANSAVREAILLAVGGQTVVLDLHDTARVRRDPQVPALVLGQGRQVPLGQPLRLREAEELRFCLARTTPCFHGLAATGTPHVRRKLKQPYLPAHEE